MTAARKLKPPERLKLRGLHLVKSRDSRWHLDDEELTDEDRAKRVNDVANRLWNANRPRRDNYARYWGLYSNAPLYGLTPKRFNQRVLQSRRLSLNAVSSVCDAYVAKVTNQRPKVTFSCDGGTWEQHQRAETLERFNDGMLYEQDMYETGPQLELDTALFGTAVIFVAPIGRESETEITYRRDFPWSFFCDDIEAHGGDPRSFYRRIWIDRLQAMALYPDHAEEIATVETAHEDDEDPVDSDNMTDSVCLTWGWHLPSGVGVWGHDGEDTGDGMMCLTIGNILVAKEACTRYPFEFLYLARPINGVWGRGFAEQLQGIQFEIDTLLNMIRVAMKTGATLRYWIPTGANVNWNQLSTDVIGSGAYFDGPQPPIAVTPPAVAPEVYQHMDRLWQKAFEVPGISQLTAQSQKPAGLNSGKAMETYADIESERFQVAFHQYQHLYLRLARQTIALCREIADENPGFSVKSVGRKTMQVVKWADAAMDDDDFAMKEYATSAFASTPEARMQQIQDSLNSGSPLISPAEGRRLLNDPDLDAFDSLADASYDLAMDMISDILTKGVYLPPEDQMDLAEAKRLGQLSWLKATRQKAPQDRLDMLDDWVQQCIAKMPAPAPAPVAPLAPVVAPSPGMMQNAA